MCSLEGSFGVFVFARGLSFVFLCPFGGFLWSLEGFPFVVFCCFDSHEESQIRVVLDNLKEGGKK